MDLSHTITWLHLSDLHLSTSHKYNQAFILESLLRDITERIANDRIEPNFIVVSGDIAYAGQAKEYELAGAFFDKLLRITGLSKDKLFLVPGNHDIDRRADALILSERNETNNQTFTNIPEPGILSQGLHNYRNFIKDYLYQVLPEPEYHYTKVIKIGERQVAVLGLNSAWLSHSDFFPGYDFLGNQQVQTALDLATRADLCLAVMHHPFEWMKHSNHTDLEALLLKSCDFFLHGHTHGSSFLQRKTADSEAIFIPSGVAVEMYGYPNSYNLVRLDLNEGKGQIHLRCYSDQQEGFWTKDVLHYLDAPDGIYVFSLPDHLISSPPSLPEISIDQHQKPTEVKIFLSYAREDRELARQLYEQLAQMGFNPWMDIKNILGGQDWSHSIRIAIEQSHFFIACLSSNFVNRRGFIQKEVETALDLWREMLNSDIFLLPVRLEPCEVPQSLQDFNYVDMFEKDGWSKLMQAIQMGLEQRGIKYQVGLSSPQEALLEEQAPSGFRLLHKLQGHLETITRIAWSPDGSKLASPSLDKTIRLWDAKTGQPMLKLEGHSKGIYSLAWSPKGDVIASGSDKGSIRIWDASSGKQHMHLSHHRGRVECLAWSPDGERLASASADSTICIWTTTSDKPEHIMTDHLEWVNAVTWSPDGKFLASGAEDNTIRIWDIASGKSLQVLRGHTQWISDVQWSHDGKLVASASNDRTIILWDPIEGAQVRVLQGHTDYVRSISFSADDRILASKSHDGTMQLWRCDTWESVATLYESTGTDFNPTPSIAFHPHSPILATLGGNDTVIRIWELDLASLLGVATSPVIEYVNAKVVLLGEGSVGKSGLAIRLAEKSFRATPPTHGAQHWQIPVEEAPGLPQNARAEITLWDLAGQQDYHLIHVLFLEDLSAALLLFDCSDAANPIRGVPYWAKVLKQRSPASALKILVSARCDICPVTVSQSEINGVLNRYELDIYERTSALTGEGVHSLMRQLVERISWDKLPRTTTPRLFQTIREFLLEQKALGTTLVNMRGIWNEIRQRSSKEEPTKEEVDTVVSLLQSQGLVQRLDPTPSESLILLKPELINQYASSIIQAARNHPEGIGAVAEYEVVQARIEFVGFQRLEWLEERIGLESVVELLIKNALCFREVGMLVFPSQININRPAPSGQRPRTEITYEFSGSIETIFASLVVRLSLTEYFERQEQWKYSAEFLCNGNSLGFSMKQVREETAELEIYFYPEVPDFDRVLFIRFITDHLHNKGIDLGERIRLYCPKCNREVENREAIAARVSAGRLDIPCQYCPDDTLVFIPRSIEEHYRSNLSYAEKHQLLSETVERRTSQEAERFKSDQRQYTSGSDHLIRILHLSDIHLGTQEEALKYRIQLEADLKRELEISRLDYLVISGDIADKSTQEEYKAAFELVDGIVKHFGLDPSRIVIVPGNHDLNWDLSSDAYSYIPKHKLPEHLTDEYILAGDTGVLRRDNDLYRQRFANFNSYFYKKIYGSTQYPLDYSEQAILHLCPDDQIVFLALNSCWQIDHYHSKRASINMEALSRALEQLMDAEYNRWLKIAVWHHPISGREMMGDDFLQQLAVNGFQVCLHGHIHEAKEDFYKYDGNRGIHIIGAGTFGAPVKEQVPGIPLQYNLLILDPNTHTTTIRTRRKDKPDGAWYADARWGDRNDPKAAYMIELKDPTF